MVQTLLPRDAHNQPIQTLAPVASHIVAIGASFERSGSNFTAGVKAVELRSTVACFVEFGDSLVEATSGGYFLHAGERVTYSIGENTRIAAIRESSDGSLYVTELA